MKFTSSKLHQALQLFPSKELIVFAAVILAFGALLYQVNAADQPAPSIPHQTDRFPQPTDLMPRPDLPLAVPSPGEPFTTVDGPGPVNLQKRDIQLELDDLSMLCMVQLRKSPTCRRFAEIIGRCSLADDRVRCRDEMWPF